MYTRYYGLGRKPFDLIPDPGVVFMSESHQEALAILRYGVIDRKGFLLLTGDVGTGKTTLLHLLVKSLANRVHVCLLTNPTISVNDFYYTLSTKFGLRQYGGSKARFLHEFGSFLKTCREKQERVLLIVDEAHAMPVKLLEEIRLLSNQEFQEYGILSIFLVGQPELNKRLGHERLLPLRQRIGIRFHLKPFTRDESAGYISFRLRRAGAQRLDLFSGEAVDLIHAVSQGVPRLINVVCDQALLSGFADSKPVIDEATVRDCVRELHIPGEAGLLPLPPKKSFLYEFRGRRRIALLLACAVLIVAGGVFLLVVRDGGIASLEKMIGRLFEPFLSMGVVTWERFSRP